MITLTIIVPCYNSSQYIRETIESVKNQKLTDWECIIVDDESTDNTIDVINNLISEDNRFKLISIEHGGPGKARNVALLASRGEYILPLDSDDILMPDFTYNGVLFLDNNPEYSLYYGKVTFPSGVVENCNYTTYKNMLIWDCLYVTGIYRKNRAIDVGGYNEELSAHEDYDFWIRYLYHNDIIKFSDNISFLYRIHPDSRHSSKEKQVLQKIKHNIKVLNKQIYKEYGVY